MHKPSACERVENYEQNLGRVEGLTCSPVDSVAPLLLSRDSLVTLLQPPSPFEGAPQRENENFCPEIVFVVFSRSLS
jgi:hypothetical protein